MDHPLLAGDVLGTRALNRALLARQMLLRRAEISALDAVERLVGLQSQAPLPPYFGLWTRLGGFRPEHLAELIEQRRVVRIALMRSTIHLVTARDCLALRPVVQPALERPVLGTYGRLLQGVDFAAVAAVARELVEAKPLAFGELGALLAERWRDAGTDALANLARALVPLVQVPPRGVWGKSGRAVHTTVEAWLGKSLDDSGSAEEMVLRYLAAFGPATVRDVQTWCGLTNLREVVERLRPRLRAFRGEGGGELFDHPDAPLPDPGTPAPPRFLPEWDNALLSHADRSRIVAEEHRARIYTVNGIMPATVLVDGFVRATWKLERGRGAATLVIRPLARLAAAERKAVAAEGERLLDFAAADATTRDITFITRP